MSLSLGPDHPDELVEKVLRRVEVAKMARKLQDRLALACYKAQNGLNNLSFNLVEAHLDNSIKRKRPRTSATTSSDTSSSSSDNPLFSSALSSPPIAAPMFSDGIPGSDYDRGLRHGKIHQRGFAHSGSSAGPRKRTRAQSTAPPAFESWKSAYKLAESSPIYHRQRARFPASHEPNLSFVSHTSAVPDSPPFHAASDDDNQLPQHSFSLNTAKFRSSPPRTPPPTRSRPFRQRKLNAAGEEGADLLLYLATSPSPANPGPKSSRIFAPSTPPSKMTALPSSMMSTPGGGGFMAGFNTPGQQFNFADFVNITPSPAQGAFGSRTPGLAKTPLAAKEARRRLNFDSLVPPGGSPVMGTGGRGSMTKETGLGMELGGELVS